MKYEIYLYDTSEPVYNKKLLYSTESPNDEVTLLSPTLTLKENGAGSLTFILPITNALYGQIRPMAQTLLISRDDPYNYIWAGRVINMEEDMYGNQQMYCEGALSFLNDTIQPPSEYKGSLIGFFNQLLNVHNSNVTGDRKIYPGVVDIAEKNTDIIRYTNYENTWECMNGKLLETYGGYMYIRMQNSKFYLDWVSDSPHTCSQDIIFGENLVDYTRNYEWDDFATVIVPTGAMLEESPIEALYAYTNVSSVNNGSIYVESPEAIKVYGRIEKYVEWPDVTVPANLLTKAKEYLSEQQFDKMEISLTALDQHMIDAGIESFDILDKVEVISPPHGLNKYFTISQITIPFDAPEETEFLLGKGSGTSLSEAISTGMLMVNSKITGLPTAQQVINISNYYANGVSTAAKNEAISSSNEYTDIASTAAKNEAISSSNEYTDSQITAASKTILEQAKEQATTLINAQGFEGYVTLKKNANNVIEEILIANDPDYTKATKIWRWNMNGLGYSNKGYNGPYTTAWTMDGQFVADFITAGTMSADRIRGGQLLLGEGVGNGVLVSYGTGLTATGSSGIIEKVRIDNSGLRAPNVNFIDAKGRSYAFIDGESIKLLKTNYENYDSLNSAAQVYIDLSGISFSAYASDYNIGRNKFALLQTRDHAYDLFVYDNMLPTTSGRPFTMYGGLNITNGGLNVVGNSEFNGAVDICNTVNFKSFTGASTFFTFDVTTGQCTVKDRRFNITGNGYLYSSKYVVAVLNSIQAVLESTGSLLRLDLYDETTNSRYRGYAQQLSALKNGGWTQTSHIFYNGGMSIGGHTISLGRLYLNKPSDTKQALLIEIDESANITHFRSKRADDSGWQTSMWIKHSGSSLAGWHANITFCVPDGIAYIGSQLEVRNQFSLLCMDQSNTDYWAVRMECRSANGRPTMWFVGGTPANNLGSNSCAVIIEGNLTVTGTKNRMIKTKSHGSRLMNAEETPEARFNDYGSGVVGDDGSVEIIIDPIFQEAIDLGSSYQVFLTRTSAKKTEWVEKRITSFVVHGEPGATFDWMISAIQKDYAGVRFEKAEEYEYQEAEVENDIVE